MQPNNASEIYPESFVSNLWNIIQLIKLDSYRLIKQIASDIPLRVVFFNLIICFWSPEEGWCILDIYISNKSASISAGKEASCVVRSPRG